MRKLYLAGALALAAPLCAPNDADAGWRSRTRAVSVTRTTSTADGATAAQAKADTQAATGRMAHVGPLPTGTVEGVGFSTSSPQAALDACCYSRSGLPLISQAVARGRNGWYAVRSFAAGTTKAVVTAPFAIVRGVRETCSGPNCAK